MFDRLFGVARAKVIPYLAALGACGIASAVNAQSILFEFTDEPDDSDFICFGDDVDCHHFDPIFIQQGFTVTHNSGGGNLGAAEWLNVGHIVLADDSGGGDSPYQTNIEFSEPVSSFTVRLSLDDDGAEAFIQPTIPDSDPPPATEIEYTGGDFELYTFDNGPYDGFRLNSDSDGSLEWDDLEVTVGAYAPDSTGERNVPVTTGEDSTVIQLDAFLMVASNVLAPIGGGEPTIDFDYCVARDKRETHAPEGPSTYTRRALTIAEVAGTGSCTGPLPGGSTDLPNGAGTVGTWEELLPKISLVIPPWNRTFRGTFEGTDGFWFVVGSIRTNAEFDGVILVKEIPETFPGLVFDAAPNPGDELACNAVLNMRPEGLSGLVAAFGEWPNVEGNLMIKSTYRCNRPATLTRRTHHGYPFRQDGILVDRKAALALQLVGLGATIQQAMTCVPNGPSGTQQLLKMKGDLVLAVAASLLHKWSKAQLLLEAIALRATNLTTYSSNDTCIPRNYKGNITARALTGAFTVWDQFLHPTTAGWAVYNPPPGIVPPED